MLVKLTSTLLLAALPLVAPAAEFSTLPDFEALYPGDPVRWLSNKEIESFDEGLRWFAASWSQAEGLGPEYNAVSCVECHRVPTPGGTAFEEEANLLLTPGTDGQLHPVSRSELEPLEEDPQRDVFRRRPPILYGLGLLSLVPEAVVVDSADPYDRDGNGVRGVYTRTPAGIGRFGWEGNIATIEEFVTKAFETELGITPQEAERRGGAEGSSPIAAVTFFISRLAAPRAFASTDLSEAGKRAFLEIGCGDCHRPSLPVEIPNRGETMAGSVSAYTDLLKHSLGSPDPPLLVRTPPLWGLGLAGPPYMHDASASSIDEAIRAHWGEATAHRERYLKLRPSDLLAIQSFLRSL